MPTPWLIRFTENVSGGPTNCIEYKEVSVQINVSCLDLIPPIISLPDESLTEPAVFVVCGCHSTMLSWSENATSMGSEVPVLAPPTIGSAPKTITCLSVSLTITCLATVGAKLAPDKVVMLTALAFVPPEVSQ